MNLLHVSRQAAERAQSRAAIAKVLCCAFRSGAPSRACLEQERDAISRSFAAVVGTPPVPGSGVGRIVGATKHRDVARRAYEAAKPLSAAFSPSGRLRPSRAQVGVMESAVFERHDACCRLSPGAFGGAGYWVICDRCAGAPLLSRLSQADKKSEPRSGCFAALCDVRMEFTSRGLHRSRRGCRPLLCRQCLRRGARGFRRRSREWRA